MLLLEPGLEEGRVVGGATGDADEAAAGQSRPRLAHVPEELAAFMPEPVVLDQDLAHFAAVRVVGRKVVDGPQLHDRQSSAPIAERQLSVKYPSSAFYRRRPPPR